jgi:hypothetical protein
MAKAFECRSQFSLKASPNGHEIEEKLTLNQHLILSQFSHV